MQVAETHLEEDMTVSTRLHHLSMKIGVTITFEKEQIMQGTSSIDHQNICHKLENNHLLNALSALDSEEDASNHISREK